MKVIKETLWKRCLSTPTKPPAKNSNICLSETEYQHKGTSKKCKKTSQAAIIQWQRQCLMYKPHPSPDRSRKQVTFLSRVPVHCITPFCSDALVSPPNLYPPCWLPSHCLFLLSQPCANCRYCTQQKWVKGLTSVFLLLVYPCSKTPNQVFWILVHKVLLPCLYAEVSIFSHSVLPL